MERGTDTTNGGGDRLDALAGELQTTKVMVGKAIIKAELAAKEAANAREGVREVSEQNGRIIAELARLNTAIGRWPTGPDDPGSGLLGRASRGSLTNEGAAMPPGASLNAPHGRTLPPGVRRALERYKRPVAIVAAVLSVLGAVAQAMQGF